MSQQKTVRFMDLENASNPQNGKSFADQRELERLLESLQNRTPFIIKLESDAGYKLTLGLGPDAAFAQHSPLNGYPPYLVALGDGSISETHVFLISGTPTEIEGKHCLSFEMLKQICQHFIETGNPFPNVEWEEI